MYTKLVRIAEAVKEDGGELCAVVLLARFQRGREAQSNRKGALLLVIKAQAEFARLVFLMHYPH
ncbi:hypothetical protein [Gracilibacillus timonensis]|uniref:hypothetical protein n=1 Tax=Gracilibacillus timonensis TaxID=1816696 RepID=UPI00082557CE|nr:hypothetical protein [Gracilibacillus timonensis]